MGKKVKAFSICLILMCSVLLSGCMRLSINLKVNEDNTVDVSILTAAINTDNLSFFDEDDVQEFKDAGFEITEYSEDGYTGQIYSKKQVPIDALAAIFKMEDTSTTPSITQDEDGSYTISMPLKTTMDQESTELQGMDMQSAIPLIQSYGGYCKVIIDVPFEVIENNADTVTETDEGTRLEWQMLGGKDVYVKYKPASGGILSLILITIFLIAIVVGIVLLIRVAIKRRQYAEYYYDDYDEYDDYSDEEEDESLYDEDSYD